MSRAILEDVLTAIDAFVSGRDEIVDIQARLCADASALGRSHLELINELRSLDADLEEIQFARLLDETATCSHSQA